MIFSNTVEIFYNDVQETEVVITDSHNYQLNFIYKFTYAFFGLFVIKSENNRLVFTVE